VLNKFRWYLETVLFIAVSRSVAWLPDRVALWGGKWLGRALFRLLKRRRVIALKNISHSLPFLERQPGWVPRGAEDLARATFENLGLSIVEACQIYHDKGSRLIDAVEFRGIEHYERARARGKGIAFLTGHCGNWELLALSFGARYENLTVVAKRQKNIYLNGVLEKIRSRYGNNLVYREGALRGMFSVLRKKGVVGIHIDQAASAKDGVLVDFLGRPAWTTNMLAVLARRNDVPLLPVFIHREGTRHVVVMHPEIELVPGEGELQDTVQMTACIDEYVINHPTEWYWIHQRWKRTPGQPS